MGLPSGDTITLTSGTITLSRGRTMSLSLKLQDNSGGTDFDASYSFKPSDVGTIDFPVDVQEDSDEVSDFYFHAISFEFSFWSNITSSVDFGAMLDQLTFSDLIEVGLTYNGNTDTYLCTKSDVKYNRLDREVTVKSYPPFKYNEQISTLDTAQYDIQANYDFNDTLGTPVEYNFLTVNDTINAYLDTFGATTNRVQSSYTEVAAGYQSGATNDDLNGFVTNTHGYSEIEGSSGEFYLDSFDTLKKRVLETGIAEAAIVGLLFDEAFYVRRDYASIADSNYYVDIASSDLEDFDLEFAVSYVRDISVTVAGETNSETISFPAYQSVNVTIPQYTNEVVIDSGGGIGTEIKAGLVGEVPFSTISSDAFSIYKKVLQASDTIKFSGTILGVDKIKPYQFVRLDTGISPYVTTGNRDIRLSHITYDLYNDKAEFEGYSI